ncbi:DEAD/DEAH box helicase family protein [Trichomonas vaginalis G3]|uniref:DEAD/DEAH box helicase family protein n=1 Tax=Trichomonas vaginalis (strain ATCC PRA-98 / G3) TaxID=412133 RepID=A2E9Y0_TRIV3|nr:helicase protein [Trichomonas vaginalis G3]EAY10542.1 DEAD/DEAH box helicase family protein [Trichomonas vaginalis G3]KAI5549295.1 helicase protein [Trichomonas vaginalis G3]|eukprot:XP_001322765.1 DEAD/DEAH box helicase family protein [Trichomonas vaginalis G3]
MIPPDQSDKLPYGFVPVKRAKKDVFIKSSVDDKQVKYIHDVFTEEKERGARNFTDSRSMTWSWKEDTFQKFRDKIGGSSIKIIDPDEQRTKYDEFERPSNRPRKAQSKSNKEMNPREIRLWRNDNQVNFRAKFKVSTPPMIEWGSPLQPELVSELREQNFAKPLVIQAASIPLSIDSYDIIGLSQPGTGKTLAYVIPLLYYILEYKKNHPETNNFSIPLSVVLVPTHELAVQVQEVIDKLGINLGIKSRTLTGSFRLNDQALELSHENHVIVATPGRLKDAIEAHLVSVKKVFFIVMDEADKMVDKSLGPQISFILNECPKEKHLMMFSATMPHEVLSIVEEFFTKVVTVSVGEIGGASENIKQVVHYCRQADRLGLLLKSLRGMKAPIIVFTNTRDSCEKSAMEIQNNGFRSAFIHGGKSQKERDSIVEGIQNNLFDVLVATDVISRGIDIPNVENVVNLELPRNIHTYVHRIGRTGRNGKEGIATSFVTKDDKEIMYDLAAMLRRGNFAIPDEMARDPSSQHRVEPTENEHFDQ